MHSEGEREINKTTTRLHISLLPKYLCKSCGGMSTFVINVWWLLEKIQFLCPLHIRP